MTEELVEVSVVMDSVLVMIRPNFSSLANPHELERCLRRHREEYGIARRANAILLLDKSKSCVKIAGFCISMMIRSVVVTRPFDRRVGMLSRLMAGRADSHA